MDGKNQRRIIRIDCSSLTSESTKISSLIDEVSNFEETLLAPIFFTAHAISSFQNPNLPNII